MKHALLFLLTLLNINCIAQINFVEYDAMENGKKVGETYMVFNDTISISGLPKEINEMKNSIFVKKFNEEVVYSTSEFLNLTFYLKEQLHSMNWELTEDTSTILNIKCLSAKADFRGRSYIAYYAPSLPFNNGPSKFGGLPGLILNIKSTDNYTGWMATNINTNYKGRFDVPDLNKYKFDDFDDFVIKYKEAVAKYIQMVKASRSVEGESKMIMKMEQDEIFYPELQTGVGIIF